MRRKSQDTYKRGALLRDGRRLQRRSARLKRSDCELLTWRAQIAAIDETKHFKLIGATGNGQVDGDPASAPSLRAATAS